MSATEAIDRHTNPLSLLIVNAGEDLRELLHLRDPVNVHHIRLDALALNAVAEIPFALIVLDIAAPGLEDVEALRALRDRWPHTPVVVVSNARETVTYCRLLRLKVFAFLVRPLARPRIEEVLDLVRRAGPGWDDDIELLSGAERWIQLRVACRLLAAERAALLFRELSVAVDAAELEEFATACREMLMNAIEHGGQCDPAQSVFVNYVLSDAVLLFYLRDPGPGFSFRNLAHAAISNTEGSLEHAGVREQLGIRPGGFGILLAKTLVDELIYNERGNEVILIKHRRHLVAR